MVSASGMALALAVLMGGAQDKKKDPQAEFQKRVDEAIRNGIEALKATPFHAQTHDLKLLTYIHAGVPQSDPKFKEAFDASMGRNPSKTYNTALLAMALEELDRVKHQRKIFDCAQFLVDNQVRNGQWNYGTPTLLTEPPPGKPVKANVATPGQKPRRATRTLPGPPLADKPPVRIKLPVLKGRDFSAEFGDNSNSQYAALGLRACHDAGIEIPKEVIVRAREWWLKSQNKDEAQNGKPDPSVTYGGIRGWDYSSQGSLEGRSYGSMSAGGVGSLIIYDHLLGNDWKKNPEVQSGMNWLAQHFSVTENPCGVRPQWHFYYLYAMERAGIFYGTEYLGRHAWYLEGAQYLLDAQKPDGSWLGHANSQTVYDTCFAILFLRRATRPLDPVESVDRFQPKR